MTDQRNDIRRLRLFERQDSITIPANTVTSYTTQPIWGPEGNYFWMVEQCTFVILGGEVAQTGSLLPVGSSPQFASLLIQTPATLTSVNTLGTVSMSNIEDFKTRGVFPILNKLAVLPGEGVRVFYNLRNDTVNPVTPSIRTRLQILELPTRDFGYGVPRDALLVIDE